MAWYLIFFAAFALFPFLFLRQFSNKVVPWAAAAMAGPPQFFLIHRFVTAVYPNHMMGLLPAAFAIPGLLSLVVVLKKISAENKCRMTQLAWFGGVALFFITLIFPIQFERQWITIGWALEGAALLWLFHRVPHPGLRLTGVGLLVAAFVRLALNPAVLEYHRARRDADFQLVSLRLRHRDGLFVRRGKTSGASAQPRFEIQCSADSWPGWARCWPSCC